MIVPSLKVYDQVSEQRDQSVDKCQAYRRDEGWQVREPGVVSGQIRGDSVFIDIDEEYSVPTGPEKWDVESEE